MTHVILPGAQEEFESAVDYLNNQRAGLGNEFRNEVVATLREVIKHPEHGSAYFDGTRYRPVGRFRYIVVYTIRDGQVLIVAIMHEARRPGYWKTRLK